MNAKSLSSQLDPFYPDRCLKLTVGSPSRAETISLLLDESALVKNSRCLFKLSSERGFLTITGHFNGTPVSIISIGMGYPNMDFFVREVRECVDGEMVIVRYA